LKKNSYIYLLKVYDKLVMLSQVRADYDLDLNFIIENIFAVFNLRV